LSVNERNLKWENLSAESISIKNDPHIPVVERFGAAIAAIAEAGTA